MYIYIFFLYYIVIFAHGNKTDTRPLMRYFFFKERCVVCGGSLNVKYVCIYIPHSNNANPVGRPSKRVFWPYRGRCTPYFNIRMRDR